MACAAGRHIDPSGLQLGAVDGLADMGRAQPVEPVREAAGEAGRHMLGDDSRRAVGRIGLQQRDQGLDAAGGRSDRHHLVAGQEIRRLGLDGGPFAQRSHARAGGRLHLLDQLREAERILPERWLADAVERAELEGAQGRVGAFLCQARNHHHRHGSQPHDLLEEFYPVHPGHFHIQGDDVGIEGLDRLAGFQGVGGRPDHLDLGIAPQEVGDQDPHSGRVVDDQDTDSAHRRPPVSR